MNLPLGFGRLDVSDWVRGLMAAFISGGASAVTSGVTVNMLDPEHYNIHLKVDRHCGNRVPSE